MLTILFINERGFDDALTFASVPAALRFWCRPIFTY